MFLDGLFTSAGSFSVAFATIESIADTGTGDDAAAIAVSSVAPLRLLLLERERACESAC